MLTPRRIALLLSLFALGWRVVHLTEWPFPYATAVQYDCALSARAIWLAADPAQRTGEKAAWFEAVRFDHVIGPPILPGLAAACYCVAGEEIPWIAKLFSSLAWVAAGWFVFLTVIRQTGCEWAAVLVLAWFEFAPFGLTISRCFQPESLLALSFAVAVWHLARPGRTTTWRETLISGVVCGLCAFVKPGILFGLLVVGFTSLTLFMRCEAASNLGRKILHISMFTALLVIPSLAYVILVLPHRGGELMPNLLLEAWYYQGVEKMIARVVGYPAFAIGLFGASLAWRAGDRLLPGLLVGYIGYLGIFTYHAATHDYYHMPLLIPVALGLGWTAANFGQGVKGVCEAKPRVRYLLAALALVAFVGYLCVTRHDNYGLWRYTIAGQTALSQMDEQRRLRDENYRIVRESIRPGTKVIAMTEEYGGPLEMEACLRVASWPPHHDIAIMEKAGVVSAGFTHDSHIKKLIADGCEFAVITEFTEFEKQPELKKSLQRFGRLRVNQPRLLIYDLRPASR